MPKHEPYLTNLPLFSQGKTRDTFRIPDRDDLLLMVATDRLSTHNIVHKSLVPGKGEILNAINVFWLSVLSSNFVETSVHIPARTHLVAFGQNIYDYLPTAYYPDDLFLRAIVVKKYAVIPVEFIWRWRMAGSLWRSYAKGERELYGHVLENGLELMSPFGPLFTPTEKSETDDPMDSATVMDHPRYRPAYTLTWNICMFAGDYLQKLGIDIIDTKFEVAIDEEGEPVLVDEVLTPDSSRFVDKNDVKIGQEPPFLDKELFRKAAMKTWDEGPKVPLIFEEAIIQTGLKTYHELFERVVGMNLKRFQEKHFAKG